MTHMTTCIGCGKPIKASESRREIAFLKHRTKNEPMPSAYMLNVSNLIYSAPKSTVEPEGTNSNEAVFALHDSDHCRHGLVQIVNTFEIMSGETHPTYMEV